MDPISPALRMSVKHIHGRDTGPIALRARLRLTKARGNHTVAVVGSNSANFSWTHHE